jgi:hypothetical protein
MEMLISDDGFPKTFHSLSIILIQGDQKVSVHLIITVKNNQTYFKPFQSLTVTA